MRFSDSFNFLRIIYLVGSKTGCFLSMVFFALLLIASVFLFLCS
jgi:hypothetical protein